MRPGWGMRAGLKNPEAIARQDLRVEHPKVVVAHDAVLTRCSRRRRDRSKDPKRKCTPNRRFKVPPEALWPGKIGPSFGHCGSPRTCPAPTLHLPRTYPAPTRRRRASLTGKFRLRDPGQ